MRSYVSRLSLLIVFSLVGSLLSISTQTADNAPLKLKVGTYNVGHFNQGLLGGFQFSGSRTTSELNNWKKWIGMQSIDILSLNEWNRYFDKDSLYDATDELLAPYYNSIAFGKENRWIYNGIATNFPLTNIEQLDLDGDYYAVVGDITVGEKRIRILSVHVPWQGDWHDGSLEKLINHLKQFEYFICMGDMNAKDENQLLFIEAGFNSANGGNMGWLSTTPGSESRTGYSGAPDRNIDNIVTSNNIKIFNVHSPKTGLNDLDHKPIIADIVITW